jgi:hypothetical protein
MKKGVGGARQPERIEFHFLPSTVTPSAKQKKNLPLQPFADEMQHEYEYSYDKINYLHN